MEKPIIFLAFANDRDAYLNMINRERKNIHRTLRRHNDEGLIKLEMESSSSLEDIFDIFLTYPDQVVIFHYGGHAEGTHLQLEQSDSSAQAAYVGGIAQLLGQQKSLQLVFLNGCATQPQVEVLLKHGVKAVIATSVPIQDQMATEFAEQFYNSLASHTPIQRAFQAAKAFVAAKYQAAAPIQIYRAASFSGLPENKKTIPWGLFVQPGEEAVLSWALPKRVNTKNILYTRFDYESRVDVNDILIDIICEALADHNPDLDDELNKEELDIPSIKREIVDSFPTPIGEQLRKLFTRSNDADHPDDMELFTMSRLRQLAITYRTTMQFICFILLSQLWDEKFKRKELTIGEDYVIFFNSFFSLDKDNFESFDFLKLSNAIIEFLNANSIPCFIDELNELKINIDQNPEGYESYVFMNSLYENLLDKAIPVDEVESLCLKAEEHLGIILKAIAFLVKYKLVTIKNIEIIKDRHQSARFRHNQITLNRALTVASIGNTEVGIEFENFTDNKSVLFIKTDQGEVSAYLNLTPFIIDENALNSDYSSKLFLYAYQDKQGYYYQFLNNLDDDPLKVDEENYPNIKIQFDRFRAEIFGQKYRPVKSSTKPVGGSRFSRKR